MKRKNNVLSRKSTLKPLAGFVLCLITVIMLSGYLINGVSAAESPSITVDLNSGAADSGSSTLDLLFLLAFIALIPTFLMMLTCFTRIVVSFSFLRKYLPSIRK